MSDKTYSLEWIQNEINYYSEMCVSASYFDYLDVLKQLRTVTAKIARLVEVGDKLAAPMNIAGMLSCPRCFSNKFDIETHRLIHRIPDCPVTLWNKEAHE